MATIQRWEYLVEEIKTIDPVEIAKRLTQLGNSRWELVAVNEVFCYFKRVEAS